MAELADFLLARIAEDEAAARRIIPGREDPRWGHWRADSLEFHGAHDRETTRHIIRWDPARVVAECEAKRRIVSDEDEWTQWDDGYDEHNRVLKLLALPYANHRDFAPAWR